MAKLSDDPKYIFMQAAAAANSPQWVAQLEKLPPYESIKKLDDYKFGEIMHDMEAVAAAADKGEPITVLCGKGRTAYKVIVTVKNVEALQEAAATDKALQFQQGEGLVAAILNALGPDVVSVKRLDMEGRRRHGANGEAGYVVFSEGKVVRKEYYNLQGELDDAPNGEAALQIFNDKGNLIYSARYRNGELNDGARGAAARCFYDDEGHLLIEEHYRRGLLDDTAYGAAARRVFNVKGQLTLKEHMKDGVLQDTKDEYARQKFEDGKMVEAESHQDGKLVKTFNTAELSVMALNPALRFGGLNLPKAEEESSTTSPHNKKPVPKEPNMMNPGKPDLKL